MCDKLQNFKRHLMGGELAILLIIGVLSFVRFYKINGGVILGEPDEYNLALVAKSLAKSSVPTYDGTPWFFELPLFPYLSFLVGKIIPGFFIPQRVVSLFASLGSALVIYVFVKIKVGKILPAAFAATAFSLMPFAVFYSRVGILEATWVFFTLSSLLMMEMAKNKQSKLFAFFSGFLLGLSLLTKYSAMFIIPLYLIFFLVRSIKFTKDSSFKEIRLDLLYGISLLVCLVMVLPFFYFFKRLDYINFVYQTKQSLGLIGGRQWSFPQVKENLHNLLGNSIWWFSLPVLVFFILGFTTKNLAWLKIFIFFLLFVCLSKVLSYPRYFYALTPFIAIFAGFGFEKAAIFLHSFVEKFLTRTRLALTMFTISMIVMLPGFLEAFFSSYHNLVEDTATYINQYSTQKPTAVFSNYWPRYFCRDYDFKYCTWFTLRPDDFRSFYPNDEGITMAGVLGKEEVWYVKENYYSGKNISPDRGRLKAQRRYLQDVTVTAVVVDDAPNFPFFKGRNKVELFKFSKSDNL